MPEFNLVNHRFFCALDTYKCIQLLIKDSQQMMQDIYHTYQICSDLVQKIEYTTPKYLNRNDFAESPLLNTDHPPPVGFLTDANGDLCP